MSKRTWILAALVAVALLAVGGLLASNLGFKLNYQMPNAAGQGGAPANGTNALALPFNRQSGIDTASQLLNDIGSADTINIQRYLENSNSIETFSGGGTPDFNLVAGEGLFIRMGATVNYIVVGSNDPSLSIPLDSAATQGGAPANGTNYYAYAYHSTASTASELLNEIGSTAVINIQRYLESSNSIETFSGAGPNFNLIPGEAYFVRMGSDVAYTPSHY